MKTRFLGIVFIIVFSSVFVSNVYGSIYFDKEVYTWTDKINIRITEHGVDADGASVKIYTDNHELDNYKLSKTGNGLYTGKIILTGFLHDVTGDGKPDTNPRTMGNGPNNGFLESQNNDELKIYIKFSDGDTISKSVKISWNKGDIVFDMLNYLLNDSPKIQVTDMDMNLNPETLDKIPIHVFSDSDKAGIIVNAIETHEESGLFETAVSFTQEHASSGNRLFAMSGDGIYAQYDDYTLPAPSGINDDLEIIAESTVFTDFPIPVIVEQELSSSITSTSIHPDDLDPPLKQIKNGVALIDVRCNEGKSPAYKHDRMSIACVSEETLNELWSRGWATMRFYTEEETSPHALCNNYEGKWHPEYEGCRDIATLQCSLMGGEFVDGLKICYDEICPVDKTYTLCVTNLDLISGEKENEN